MLTKCVHTGAKKNTIQKVGNALGYFYTILGTYKGFDPQLNLECQSELVYYKFEQYWDFDEMVIHYYTKYPDPELKIIKKDLDGDDGADKLPAVQEGVESSDEGDNE